jgi:hypothetical protein
VSAKGKQTGMWPSNHSTQQSQVYNTFNVIHTMKMMGDAHRPGKHNMLCLTKPVGDFGYFRTRYTGIYFNIYPRQRFNVFLKIFNAFSIILNETVVFRMTV